MSEWSGTGLQNRLHQFESGWNLRKATPSMEIGGVVSLLAYTIVFLWLWSCQVKDENNSHYSRQIWLDPTPG